MFLMLARASPLFLTKRALFEDGNADVLLSRRCWFQVSPDDAKTSGEVWISGTVTKKTIGLDGDKVTLEFHDEQGMVSPSGGFH